MTVAIVDDFLDDYEGFRRHCDAVDYTGTVNPVDGVLYPGISTDIPDAVKEEYVEKLAKVLGAKIVCNMMFLRLTIDGYKVPHQAHSDKIMGDRAAIIYLSREEHVEGGTSLVTHIETGMDVHPVNDEQENAWEKDTNNFDAWKVDAMVDMKSNRMVTIPAERMHRPEPPFGFGQNSVNGRLVMVCFYSVINDD